MNRLHADIKASFMEWIQDEIQRNRREYPEMRPGRIAQVVTDTAFATLLNVWENSYGPKQVAEDFYQVADEMVARSNRKDDVNC